MKIGMRKWALVVALSLWVVPVFADEPNEIEARARLERLSDAEVNARLDYLIQRLDDRSTYATTWWAGWTGFYALGVVVESVRAGLEDKDEKQADLVVSAVKATFGTVNLLRHPLAWQKGASAVRALPGDTHEDRVARLALAEEKLHQNAKATDRRLWWGSHLMNVGINCAGAAIVHGAYDDPIRAWRSAGIGIAVGELMLFSHPWWYRDDWNEYERRFDQGASAPRVSWQLVPMLNGAALQARF
jgi:hypothetical protein